MKKYKKVLTLSLTFFCIVFETSYAESSSVTENLVSASCNNSNGCYTEAKECNKTCGCEQIYKLDEATGECRLDYDYLKERMKTSNEMQADGEEIQLSNDDGLAKRMRRRNDRIFSGIMYCALFILVCASVCVISAGIFCYKINISDEKLKNEVEALAAKMDVEYHKKKSMKKKTRDPKEENCTVIVEDAHIMCV